MNAGKTIFAQILEHLPRYEFDKCIKKYKGNHRVRNRQAQARINTRIRRLSLGNFGNVRSIGEGVSELRIDYGPGYRGYFIQRVQILVVLLAGGDKRTQDRDIKKALKLAREL